jgi:S1-C subfamily serine protease
LRGYNGPVTTRPVLLRSASLVAAGAAGAVLALAGNAVIAGDRGTTTVRELVPATPPVQPALARSQGMSVNDIYERAKNGVVQINTTSVVSRAVPDPFFGFGVPEYERQQALGSGFVLDTAGHIITNYHVVRDVAEGNGEISVSFSNRDRVKAKIVGTDPSTDIAVLEVETKSRALTPLELGDSDAVRVGDPVVAIGNPFGLERTVTAGIVSALQRQIAAPNQDSIDHVIQTDAQINEGNSGGPLLQADAKVIGVNTAIVTGNPAERGNVGIGFAVPINTVRDVAAQLIEKGSVERPFLGVVAQEIDERLAQLFRLPVDRGLIVQSVTRGSGADEAGIRPGTTRVVVAGESYVLGGDIIVSADGRKVSTFRDLRRAIEAKKPGETLELEVHRDGEVRKIEVKLGRRTHSG